jgi:glycosyltransferase involved in cell wall biosynthesis
MTVSIIIPNYNHAKYLTQRIDSILNQTYRSFEIIILDDCSTDNSREIIDNYCSHFPFISSNYNSINSGSPFIQWDRGVKKAKGEFIWIAESDDFAEPDFLEKTSAILTENKNVGLVYCNSKVIDEQKQTEYLSSVWNLNLNSTKWETDYINDGKEELSEYLFLNCIIHNVSGVLFRRSKYSEAGFADHAMKFCGDWCLYIRLMLISDIAYISEPINTLRLHPSSTFYKFFISNTYLREVIKVHSFVRKNVRLSLKMKLRMGKSVLHIIRMRIMNLIQINNNNSILP